MENSTLVLTGCAVAAVVVKDLIGKAVNNPRLRLWVSLRSFCKQPAAEAADITGQSDEKVTVDKSAR